MTKKETIIVGKILKVHGIKGLLKLKSYMYNPQDIFNYPILFNEDLTKSYKIKFKNNKNEDTFIVSVDDIDDISKAEKLKDLTLYIEKSNLPKTESGEFYFDDLIGLNVLTDSKKSGTILQVNDFGAGSMIEVKWKDGEIETLPFTDDFIKEINLKKKFIMVILPEYITDK